MARARLPQAACCAVQGVGHDVSPCSGPLGAALGSGGAWRGARLLPGLQYGRYPSRFADILRDSRFRTPISFAILGRVHLVSCAAHGAPLAAHQCVTPLAIFSWLAKQDRIERELSATRLSLSQLQNKSSQPPVPIYSSTVCNTGIQYLSRFAERYLSRFAFRIFFPQKKALHVGRYLSFVSDACYLSRLCRTSSRYIFRDPPSGLVRRLARERMVVSLRAVVVPWRTCRAAPWSGEVRGPAPSCRFRCLGVKGPKRPGDVPGSAGQPDRRLLPAAHGVSPN